MYKTINLNYSIYLLARRLTIIFVLNYILCLFIHISYYIYNHIDL